jgi:FKBP-type peptidyl-prolyl cis-trans isomerase (trigger factor)
MDDYLIHIKKTKEDLTAEWKPAAETRAKLQLLLNEIAKDKEITPDAAEVETQTAQLKEKFKDADEHRVKLYVASMLMNEAVMKHLENV